MNTQLNTRTWQRLFSPSFVTLSVGIVMVLAMLAVGSPSVQAQTTTASDAPVDSSITLAVKGSVTDPNGTINVTGNVIITCRRVIDTTSVTSPSLVLLDFDFSQLKGTSGSTKATLKTYVTGDNHATEIRPLQASDTVIVPTPYYDSSKDALSARTMLVSATLNFDIASGKLTSGSLSVGNNVVTSAAVGSVTAAPIQ
jgi:hypothetical protein